MGTIDHQALWETFVGDSPVAAMGSQPATDTSPGPYGFADLLLSGQYSSPRKRIKDWEECFDELPILRAAIGRKSDRVARKKWHLHRPSRDLKKSHREGILADVKALEDPGERISALAERTESGELVEIHKHPLLRLIHGGNGYFTGFWVRWLLSTYLDLVGEVPVILDVRNVRGYDIPVLAFPVPPSWCKERPTPKKPEYTFIFNGYRLTIPAQDVLWMRVPSPANPYGRSTGLAMTLADELDADESAAKFIARHFYHRGRPDVLITGKDLGGNEHTNALERKWARKGRDGAGAPMFLGADKPGVHQLGYNMEQLQMPSLRRMGRDHVLQTVGMPPELMGVLDNGSNRSTVDAAGAIFDEWAILPRMVQLQEEFELRLLSRYPGAARNAVLSYDSPIGADKEFQLKTFRAQPSSPTQGEWRRLQRLHTRPGDDVHLVKGRPTPRLDEPTVADSDLQPTNQPKADYPLHSEAAHAA